MERIAPKLQKIPKIQDHNIAAVILANRKPVFAAKEEKRVELECKRDQKEVLKRMAKTAKENKRTNRDEDMDFFVAYYTEKFPGV